MCWGTSDSTERLGWHLVFVIFQKRTGLRVVDICTLTVWFLRIIFLVMFRTVAPPRGRFTLREDGCRCPAEASAYSARTYPVAGRNCWLLAPVRPQSFLCRSLYVLGKRCTLAWHCSRVHVGKPCCASPNSESSDVVDALSSATRQTLEYLRE